MLAIQLQKGHNAAARETRRDPAAFTGGGGQPGQPGPAAGESGATARRPRGEAAAALGAELRRLRLDRGLSQRRLTRLIGLSAHSNLGEYERGSRVPPRDIVVACERLLSVPSGHLQRMQEEARRERARTRRRAAASGGDGT